MKNKVDVIAFYLPQFHAIPENNEWWEDNFTEWNNVKRATPLFEGHVQPKIPLNKNYYDLLNDDVKIWQAEIARKHGVTGFCYYHYWFNGKMLLEKPMEQMLKNKEISIDFCISWANESWAKTWVGEPSKILIEQTYGGREEWLNHYNYLREFFLDKRYIKKNNKPLFVLYKPENIPNCLDMMEYWNELAIKDGFAGVCFGYQTIGLDINGNYMREKFDYNIEFQPAYALFEYDKNRNKKLRKIKRILSNSVGKIGEKVFHWNPFVGMSGQKEVRRIDFSSMCEKILNMQPASSNSIPGAFAKWDNTPRKGKRGICYTNNTPELFQKFFTKQIQRTINVYNKDMIFIYAWNEWAEGGYLEPDEEYGFQYLEAIKNALLNNGCIVEEE